MFMELHLHSLHMTHIRPQGIEDAVVQPWQDHKEPSHGCEVIDMPDSPHSGRTSVLEKRGHSVASDLSKCRPCEGSQLFHISGKARALQMLGSPRTILSILKIFEASFCNLTWLTGGLASTSLIGVS